MLNAEKINHTEPETSSKNKAQRSKYELTLAEFPIFDLSKGGKKVKSLHKEPRVYEDEIIGKNNSIVKREWRVYPDSEHGFGTSSTFETLFDLFQIWKEDNFQSPYIQFGTIYNLVKRKGQSIGKQQYLQVTKDLRCLVGIKVIAKNAFWDNERKGYVDMTFHLFDRLEIYKEKPHSNSELLPFARIKASDVLYGSVLKNSLLYIDFDSSYFYSLKPIEQRLAIYLSKVFRSQSVHRRELLMLAKQIPIEAKETKHIKETLKKACIGLLEKNYYLLQSFEFAKATDGKTDLIVFNRKGSPKNVSNFNGKSTGGKENFRVEILVEDILEVCQDEKSRNFYTKIARLLPQQLIYRAISEVKEVSNSGEIKKNNGALFVSLIKKYAEEEGIDL